MSSVHRLLIFHASIGTEHVQTSARFLPPALVWLHLTFCEIRTRFNSCNAEQRLGERTLTESGWKTSRRVQLCSLLYLCERAPIMLPFKSFVTGERAKLFWFASPLGWLKQPMWCFKSLILMTVSVWGGGMFPVGYRLFIYGVFSDTYLHHYHPFSCDASESEYFTTKRVSIVAKRDKPMTNISLPKLKCFLSIEVKAKSVLSFLATFFINSAQIKLN